MKRILSLVFAVTCFILTSCTNEHPTTSRFSLSTTSFEICSEEEGYSVEIISDGAWVATSDSQWISITTDSGSKGISEILFTVEENNEDATREGKITVTSDKLNLSTTLTIKQFQFSSECLEIHYTTNYNEILEIREDIFNAPIVLHDFSNKSGVIKCAAPITTIKDEAFFELQTLATITLPESVDSIGAWAFWGCFALKNINIPERVTTIGDSAFASCSALTNITLPESLQYVGCDLFYGCESMEAFYGKFASEDNRCLIVDNTLRNFASKGLTQYEIPEGVTQIAFATFYYCVYLESITIPESVTSIEDMAFYCCDNLSSIYCKCATPPTLGEMVFDANDGEADIPINCTIYVPTASVEAYKAATYWSKYASRIEGYDF